MPNINDLLKSLIAMFKSGDYDLLEMAAIVMQLGLIVIGWFQHDEDGPMPVGSCGADGDTVPLAQELIREATGNDAPTGMIASLILAMVVRVVIGKLMDLLNESGLPQEVIVLIEGWLEALLDRLGR